MLASELMPTRSMKDANKAVFNLLDEYCSIRDEPLCNAGQPRWISTTSRDKDFLIRAELTQQLSFSTSVKVARFDLSKRAYFVTSGLDASEPPAGVTVEEVDGGVLTTFLAELEPRPAVPPAEVRNIVEVADKVSTVDYSGHDPIGICGLFPKIQVFSTMGLVVEETFKVFFLICLADRRRVDQWIDQQLADALAGITEISPDSIPYEVLCRSLLDMDPAALFLGLYRCLEALYAHAHAQELMTTIGLERDWVEMAEILESTLGWYPREEPSLETLLATAPSEVLRDVASALKEAIPKEAREASFVAKRIYQLRNALVHYRPFHRKVSTNAINWNRLCEAMTGLVRHAHKECSI
jgi:hypothetical protein